MSSRLAINVGDTFTDLLLYDDSGKPHLHKTPSNARGQTTAILSGIQKLLSTSGIAASHIEQILLGTDIASHILQAQNGAKIGLLVTENFEHMLHLDAGPLGTLADLEYTKGIRERVNARGELVTALDEEQADTAIEVLLQAGVESICVSLLHAYANPRHEQRLKDMIAEHSATIPVSLSSELLPEFQEDERTVLLVMNAYLQPAMQRYLDNLARDLNEIGITCPINIMRSDGGLMSTQRAVTLPAYTVAAGNAGGASGAALIASNAGYLDALGLEINDISSAVSLIQDGEPTRVYRVRLETYSVRVPAVECQNIKIAAHSIARVSASGTLQVGPECVLPVCYGKGGETATVTDAGVVLGRLPATLMDGAVTLDVKAAENAIARLAQQLELEIEPVAQGIIDLATEELLAAMRVSSTQKGLDTTELALVAYGEAGAVHGNDVASLAGCYPVIVPPRSGGLAAWGFLQAEVRHEFAQTFIRPLADVDIDELGRLVDRLGQDAAMWLADEGVAEPNQSVRYEAKLRYRRYDHSIRLALDAQSLGNINTLSNSFQTLHEQRYGFKLGTPIELVTVCAIAEGKVFKDDMAASSTSTNQTPRPIAEQHPIYFDGVFVNAKLYQRSDLQTGQRIRGPALVLHSDSTTLIHPNHFAEIDGFLNILIWPEGATAV